LKNIPWRRGAEDIASASGTEDLCLHTLTGLSRKCMYNVFRENIAMVLCVIDSIVFCVEKWNQCIVVICSKDC
jgi:hypothetical protein